MIWFSCLLGTGRAGNVPPPAGSTVADGPDDHHTCEATGGATGLRRLLALL